MVILFGGSLYGLVRYEENPIVTEYGPQAYSLMGASLLWTLGLVLESVPV